MGDLKLKTKTIKPIVFQWDQANKDKSLKKHKVGFRESEEIFFNSPLKTLFDKSHSQTEERLIAFGKTNKGKRLFVSLTIRENKIRIISARPMSKKERQYYEQKEKS